MTDRARDEEAQVDERRSCPGGFPAVAALLRELSGLRRLLEADLALAASALEVGAPGLAAEVVAADLADLARFRQRAVRDLLTGPAARPGADPAG